MFEGRLREASDFPRYGDQPSPPGLESLQAGRGPYRADGAQVRRRCSSRRPPPTSPWRRRARRLISLQNIETELTAHELAAWQTVIRVMAHEVMNSLTPISSLAATADIGLVRQAGKTCRQTMTTRANLADASEALGNHGAAQ